MCGVPEQKVPKEELPEIDDKEFGRWLEKQLATMNRRIARWKDHLDQKHGFYEWKTAKMWRRCIKDAAAGEVIRDEYNERIEKAISILGSALASEQVYAATYQSVVDALAGKEKS